MPFQEETRLVHACIAFLGFVLVAGGVFRAATAPEAVTSLLAAICGGVLLYGSLIYLHVSRPADVPQPA